MSIEFLGELAGVSVGDVYGNADGTISAEIVAVDDDKFSFRQVFYGEEPTVRRLPARSFFIAFPRLSVGAT